MAEEKRQRHPNVANLVKRISLDLQSKSNSEVTFRKGGSDLRHKHAKALFSYTPDNDDELRLEINDVIEVLGEEEEGWWRGRLKGRDGEKDKVGVFPSNFVKLLDQSESGDNVISGHTTIDQEEKMKSSDPAELSQSQTTATTQSSSASHDIIQPKKIHGIGFGNIFAGEGKIELKKTGGGGSGGASIGGESKKIDIVNKDATATTVSSKTAALNGRREQPCQKIQEFAKVAFAYEAENDDELTLKEGEVVVVLSKQCEDPGWWRGELNGKEGVFPDNFVELMSAEETEKYRKSITAPTAAPPVVPAKPVKLVGSIRPMSPDTASAAPLSATTTIATTPPNTTTTTAATTTTNHKQPPERPPPPAAADHHHQQHFNRPLLPKTSSPATATPPSGENKDKTPPDSSVTPDKTNDHNSSTAGSGGNKSSTPKKFITSPLSLLMNSQQQQKQKTPISAEEPKPSTKVVDVERDAVAPLDSERLTHPTALRPRNPNKRPPSQAFLKDLPNVGSPPFPDAVDGGGSSATVVSPPNTIYTSSIKASGDRADNGEFVRRDEFEKLKSEFELFKKETQEKLRNFEKLFATSMKK